VRKPIKNLHMGVYPPNGRIRMAAPVTVSDDAVRLASPRVRRPVLMFRQLFVGLASATTAGDMRAYIANRLVLNQAWLISRLYPKRRPQGGIHYVLRTSAPFPDSDAEHLNVIIYIVDVDSILARFPDPKDQEIN
jgi:hypothetical protein